MGESSDLLVYVTTFENLKHTMIQCPKFMEERRKLSDAFNVSFRLHYFAGIGSTLGSNKYNTIVAIKKELQ